MSTKTLNANKKWKIVLQFWSAVIFSFGFYLIYYFYAKKRILKLKKIIASKFNNLRNLCFSLNNGIIQATQDLVLDFEINDEAKETKYNDILELFATYFKNNSNLIKNNFSIRKNIERIVIVEKNLNLLVQHFNILLFKFPYNYAAMHNNLVTITIISSNLKDLIGAKF